jgi:hypothetical protein
MRAGCATWPWIPLSPDKMQKWDEEEVSYPLVVVVVVGLFFFLLSRVSLWK